MTADLPQLGRSGILREYLPFVVVAGWPGVVRNMIDGIETLRAEDLMIASEAACEGGHEGVMSVIRPLLSSDAMTQLQWNNCARKAAQDGYIAFLAFLLPRCNFEQMIESLEHAICLAAGDGLLDILNLFLSSRSLHPQTALTKALIIAARNGHHDVCMLLLSQKTDACKAVAVDFDDDFTISRGEARRHEQTWTRLSNRRPARMRNHRSPFHEKYHERDRVTPKGYNALEACLEGYRPFFARDEYSRLSSLSLPWRLADEPTHARTLNLLVGHIADFRGLHSSYAICHSAKLCSFDTLEILLAKGADASASFQNRTALTYAASRERSTLPVLRILLEAGAGVPLETGGLQQTLNAAVALFDDNDRRRRFFPFCDLAKAIL